MPENNRESFQKRSYIYTAICAVSIFVFFWIIYVSMPDVSDIQYSLYTGVTATILFVVWQVHVTQSTLNIPENEADLIRKGDIVNPWAFRCAISAFGTFGVFLLAGGVCNGGLTAYYVLTVVIGSGVLGAITWAIAFAIGWLIAPEQYIPWNTELGYCLYLRRLESRHEQGKILAERIRIREETQRSIQENQPKEPEKPVSRAGVIFRKSEGLLMSSDQEIGSFDDDNKVYEGASWGRCQIGSYESGHIYGPSGAVFRNEVGRYEKANVYNGYLLYKYGSKESIGLVRNSGEICRINHSHSGSEVADLLSCVIEGMNCTTIGSFSGSNVEGAAAAAFLLFFNG